MMLANGANETFNNISTSQSDAGTITTTTVVSPANTSYGYQTTYDFWYAIDGIRSRIDACIALLVCLIILGIIYLLYRHLIQKQSRPNQGPLKPACIPSPAILDHRGIVGDYLASGSEAGSRHTVSTPSNAAPGHEVMTITIEGSRTGSESPAVVVLPQKSVKLDAEVPDVATLPNASVKFDGGRVTSKNSNLALEPQKSEKLNESQDVIELPDIGTLPTNAEKVNYQFMREYSWSHPQNAAMLPSELPEPKMQSLRMSGTAPLYNPTHLQNAAMMTTGIPTEAIHPQDPAMRTSETPMDVSKPQSSDVMASGTPKNSMQPQNSVIMTSERPMEAMQLQSSIVMTGGMHTESIRQPSSNHVPINPIRRTSEALSDGTKPHISGFMTSGAPLETNRPQSFVVKTSGALIDAMPTHSSVVRISGAQVDAMPTHSSVVRTSGAQVDAMPTHSSVVRTSGALVDAMPTHSSIVRTSGAQVDEMPTHSSVVRTSGALVDAMPTDSSVVRTSGALVDAMRERNSAMVTSLALAETVRSPSAVRETPLESSEAPGRAFGSQSTHQVENKMLTSLPQHSIEVERIFRGGSSGQPQHSIINDSKMPRASMQPQYAINITNKVPVAALEPQGKDDGSGYRYETANDKSAPAENTSLP